MKKYLRLGAGVAVAAMFVLLIAQQVNLQEISKVLSATRTGWLWLALVAFAFGYTCRIWRWQVLLQPVNQHIRWRDCAGPFMASFALNNVLPFRAGDVVRAFAFSARLGVGTGPVLATLLIERLLDLLAVLLALALALWVSTPIGSLASLSAWAAPLILLTASFILGLILMPKLFHWPIQLAVRLLAKVTPGIAHKIGDEAERAFAALAAYANWRLLIGILLWTWGAWLGEMGLFLCVGMAIPDLSQVMGAMLALPLATLATLIPSTPGYVGTFDYFAKLALEQTGNGTAAATVFALLAHLLLWLPPTLIGGAYLLLQRWLHKNEKVLSGENA